MFKEVQAEYEALITRCKEAKEWYIQCLVDEIWTGFRGPAPFTVEIKDGVFHCWVVSTTFREARLKVMENIPVIKFLNDFDD